MCIEIVSSSKFNYLVKVKFNNILDGFNKYKYIELQSEKNNKKLIEKDFIKAIEEFYEISKGHLIIDFYKERLDENSISFIKENIDKEDIIYFEKLLSIAKENENFYYVNNKEILRLLIKLCTRELYFVTFYFYSHDVTLWGNYNLKFPLFYDNDIEITKYISISQNNKIYK